MFFSLYLRFVCVNNFACRIFGNHVIAENVQLLMQTLLIAVRRK